MTIRPRSAFVFDSLGLRSLWFSSFCFLFLLLAPAAAKSTELKQATLQAWNAHIREADAGMQERAQGRRPFLWVDEASDRTQRAQRGEIIAAPAGRAIAEKAPNGLIYDWVGAMFIPGATIADVFAVVSDYDHYRQIYGPTVVGSKLIARDGGDAKFWMRMAHRTLSVTAAMDGEYESHCTRSDASRWSCNAFSTSVREIRNFGQTGEYELPPDQGNGFVWRLYSIYRFEERDGGVYVELEAIALSRDIPAEVRWLVQPIVDRLPRRSIAATLEETRDAVLALRSSAVSAKEPGGSLGGCNVAAPCSLPPVQRTFRQPR